MRSFRATRNDVIINALKDMTELTLPSTPSAAVRVMVDKSVLVLPWKDAAVLPYLVSRQLYSSFLSPRVDELLDTLQENSNQLMLLWDSNFSRSKALFFGAFIEEERKQLVDEWWCNLITHNVMINEFRGGYRVLSPLYAFLT